MYYYLAPIVDDGTKRPGPVLEEITHTFVDPETNEETTRIEKVTPAASPIYYGPEKVLLRMKVESAQQGWESITEAEADQWYFENKGQRLI